MDRLVELDSPLQVFALVEEDGFRIGSGRPSGPRDEAWGACSVLARAAIEAGLRRLHQEYCGMSGCKSSGPPLDPAKFRSHLVDHGITMVEPVPLSLHLQLLEKEIASDGSGQPVDGPRTIDDLMSYVSAISHIRNGRAHKDEKKTSRLPHHAAGVLWVEASEANLWTIQKPHALSALRFAELLYRVVAWWALGLEAAEQLRSKPACYFADFSEPVESSDVQQQFRNLQDALGGADRKAIVDEMRSLRRVLISEHVAGQATGQLELPELDIPETLFHPVLKGTIS